MVADTDVRNTQGTIEGRDRTTVYAKHDVINEGGTIKQTNEKGKPVSYTHLLNWIVVYHLT